MNRRGFEPFAAASYEAAAPPLTGLPGKWRKATCECKAICLRPRCPRFGQFGDQRAAITGPMPGYRGEQVFFLAPCRRSTNRIIDIIIDLGQFLSPAS